MELGKALRKRRCLERNKSAQYGCGRICNNSLGAAKCVFITIRAYFGRGRFYMAEKIKMAGNCLQVESNEKVAVHVSR